MDVLNKINQRQRQILVNSYIYEDLNDSLIDDITWDKWAKELVNLMTENPKEAEDSVYYRYFKSWTGDTASDLCEAFRLPEIMNTGNMLIQYRNDHL